MNFIRKHLFDELWEALHRKPQLLQVVLGPRQVGKTTLAKQVMKQWLGPKIYETADAPNIPVSEWIEHHWQRARRESLDSKRTGLLILDEVQKIPGWSEVVKKLADQDKAKKIRLRVLILGSSALLVQRGLTESLAGRFELHRHLQWSYKECRECFGLSLQEYFIFGGYPGALPLRKDTLRWGRYIRDTLIETVVGKDVLLMSPVQKPALLRQVFGMACAHPAEILSYQKMIGQLSDAGNTVTIAHYFHLLAAAFLIAPLSKWSGSHIRQKGSTPKIVLRDASLVNALMFPALKRSEIDFAWMGRLTENAVGAALVALAEQNGAEIFYWRERSDEVDYVVRFGKKLLAIEVKSGKNSFETNGMRLFKKYYPETQCVLIGNSKPLSLSDSIRYLNLKDFFNNPSSIL